ncbi:MAG: c-type cytochrome biogenesis protein CcmI [Burkholderiaceae bacterium]
MSIFLIGFLLFIAAALWTLLPALLRRAPTPTGAVADAAGAREANLQILREQLAALELEHANGTLNAQAYGVARSEIERRALEEESQPEHTQSPDRASKTAITVAITLPLFAFVLYGLLGDPEAMLPRAAAQATGAPGEVTMPQIEAMVAKLAQRLENQTAPQEGDGQAWTMLARSYSVLQRYADASRAYARARALVPESAQLLADHADVMAMLQGQSLVGEPARMAERALKLDPKNLKALALSGSAAFESKDFKGALDFWGRALSLAQPGSDFAHGLESSMQQARTAMGSGGGQATTTAAAGQLAVVTTGPATSGVVQLAGALTGKVAPTDTVFIYARAAQGPRMPLAILKRQAGELPISFSLDDSSAMSPEMKLSKFSSVVVGARISRSGNALPQSGDLTGQVGPVHTGSGKLIVTIDTVQP